MYKIWNYKVGETFPIVQDKQIFLVLFDDFGNFFFFQVFIQGGDSGSFDRDEQGDPMENHALEKRIYILRKSMTHKMAEMESQRFYVCSLSTKTIVYKVKYGVLWVRDHPYITSA